MFWLELLRIPITIIEKPLKKMGWIFVCSYSQQPRRASFLYRFQFLDIFLPYLRKARALVANGFITPVNLDDLVELINGLILFGV